RERTCARLALRKAAEVERALGGRREHVVKKRVAVRERHRAAGRDRHEIGDELLADLLHDDGLRRRLLLEADDVDQDRIRGHALPGSANDSPFRARSHRREHQHRDDANDHSASPNVTRGALRIPNKPTPYVAAPQNRPLVSAIVGPTTYQLVPLPSTSSSP